MSYLIQMTKSAEKDLRSAVDYLDFVLLNPMAADALLEETESKINDLQFFPEAHPLVDDAVLKSWGIRFVMVKNYLAFYTVDHENNTVYIVRFLHSKRNWPVLLKQSIPFTTR